MSVKSKNLVAAHASINRAAESAIKTVMGFSSYFHNVLPQSSKTSLMKHCRMSGSFDRSLKNISDTTEHIHKHAKACQLKNDTLPFQTTLRYLQSVHQSIKFLTNTQSTSEVSSEENSPEEKVELES
ncbi:hypothetical protein PCE1_002394 [Barthelona sp. PCE]